MGGGRTKLPSSSVQVSDTKLRTKPKDNLSSKTRATAFMRHADKLNWPTRRKAKPPRPRDSIYPVGRATVFQKHPEKHTDKPSRLIWCKAKLPSPNDNTSIDRATVPPRQVNIPGRLVQFDASLNIFWNKYSQDRETAPDEGKCFSHILLVTRT